MRIARAGRLLAFGGVISALLAAVPAMAAVDMYMTIKGAGMDENIKLISVVRDTPTGMSTGRRMHSTITITKEVDEASPRLAKASSSNATLGQVTITFQGASRGAKTVQKIVLTNATILSVRKAGNREQITLDYQAIEVTWTDGGKSATDDWESPT